ncbi:uncharacterized protein LOC111242758 isoform X2 [Vigna radiata var. radiata]|uniref:Uncharacterized protein LOC111242758 isoform X2 n=1 Tax=Vigna radiata var. radiata TaxID=3916 RepID=A0A3Q0FLP9_VIGRR|nr:uncharacterized protein LOC111242758 isoform X2 [Vigna radiata var. radiata]
MEVGLRIFLVSDQQRQIVPKCWYFANVVKSVSVLTNLHDPVSMGHPSKPANTQGGIGKLCIVLILKAFVQPMDLNCKSEPNFLCDTAIHDCGHHQLCITVTGHHSVPIVVFGHHSVLLLRAIARLLSKLPAISALPLLVMTLTSSSNRLALPLSLWLSSSSDSAGSDSSCWGCVTLHYCWLLGLTMGLHISGVGVRRPRILEDIIKGNKINYIHINANHV